MQTRKRNAVGTISRIGDAQKHSLGSVKKYCMNVTQILKSPMKLGTIGLSGLKSHKPVTLLNRQPSSTYGYSLF